MNWEPDAEDANFALTNELTERIRVLEADNKRLSELKTGKPKYNKFVFYKVDDRSLGCGGIIKSEGKQHWIEQVYPPIPSPEVIISQRQLIGIDQVCQIVFHHRTLLGAIKNLYAVASISPFAED